MIPSPLSAIVVIDPWWPRELPATVAYHDACHALRVLKVHAQPRALLRRIPGLQVVDIGNGDRCCGAAGLYNVTQPEMSGELRRQKAEAVAATGATTVASANPGCTMQLVAGLRELGIAAEVVHPVQLLDRAYRGPADRGFPSGSAPDLPSHHG